MKLAIIDTESTGIDVFTDRVVTAFVGLWDTEEERFTAHLEFLVNPGIPIPAGATEVHGITDAVASQGMDPEEFLETLFYILHDWAEYPLVAYNVNYDLSLLNAELERHGHAPFDWNKRQILDPLVLERHYNKYVRGKKRLIDIAGQRGITLDENRLHTADYDAEVTARVAAQQINQWGLPSNDEQAQWHETWRADFETYLRGVKGDATLVIERGWPVREKEEK